ncbi:uncharacterized protein EI90DRAFT_3020067 [Cantharellus anzutake]|uniref:uncharacterized protein n=1 Tax=Cantharellus anzutake TaxID=1750568 RepID=UPI001905C376|nr:uncharacterized protein EI90DRAFT_3020067 [Cantharellus anzutake]KAF8322397.1 hypothetical protein EI90DRAFT_3020067 [Cantharellus anzutake]
MTRFGHVQANTVLPEFHRAAQGINSELLSQTRQRQSHDPIGEDSDDDNNDSDYAPSNQESDDDQLLGGDELDTQEVEDLLHQHAVEPLKGVFFQGYNELQHRIARRSGAAETMHGAITAALAGQYAQLTECTKAEEMSSYNYWTINFSGIAQEKQTGRAIFEKILTPLVDTWVDPELVDKLRCNLVIFKPEVLQWTYLWTTYPLFWAIDHIYQSEVRCKKEGCPANLLLQELLSALERAGSFGFCGAGRVLSTYAMNPLLLSVGIKETGFPCLSDMVGIHFERMEKIDVDASRWPKDAAGVPRFASKHVVLYNYSQATYDSFFCVCMGVRPFS